MFLIAESALGAINKFQLFWKLCFTLGEDQLLVGPQLLQPELGFCKILNVQYCVYLLTINIPQEIGENVLGLAGKELAVSHLEDGISIARLAYGTLFSSAFLIASLTASCTISTPTTWKTKSQWNSVHQTSVQSYLSNSISQSQAYGTRATADIDKAGFLRQLSDITNLLVFT